MKWHGWKSGSLVVLSAAWTLPSLAMPVNGQVLDPDGKPLAEATIILMPVLRGEKAEAIVLKSGADGRFTGDMPETAGDEFLGRVFVKAPDLAPQQRNLLKTDTAPLKFQLVKGVVVRGEVKDAEGKAVANATVRLNGVLNRGLSPDDYEFLSIPESLQSTFTARTGTDGRWAIVDVPPKGDATFLLSDTRFAQAGIRLPMQPSVTPLEAPPLAALPGAILEGAVRYEDGRPAAGIRVTAGGAGMGESQAFATTDEQGKYRLESLKSGPHYVTGHDEAGATVAEPHKVIAAQAGQTLPVPPLVMVKGVLIEGIVTDAQSGAPLAGVWVSTSEGRGARSDKSGRYQMRVLPGAYRLHISGVPRGYLFPEEGSPVKSRNLQIEAGKDVALDWQLKKGLTLSGVARDEAGAPAAGARAQLRFEQERWGEPQLLHANDKGEWKVEGLQPGEYTLSGTGEWEVVAPAKLTLPLTGEAKIQVRHEPLQTLTGRVVTPDGAPVVGAQIAANISVPIDKVMSTSHTRQLQTDAAGQFRLEGLRANHRVGFSVTRDGYEAAKGGEVRRQDGRWSVADTVLKRLGGRINGRVLDAAGKPVAGIKVLSPDGGAGARTQTDAEGHFVLQQLPDRELTVVAVGQAGAATLLSRPAATVVTLNLRPQRRLTQADKETALSILQDVWETSRGTQWQRRMQLMGDVLPYDETAALDFAREGDGKPLLSSVLYYSIAEMSRQDRAKLPALALHLAAITEPYMRSHASYEVAMAAATAQPELALSLYEALRPEDNKDANATTYLLLMKAALALRLQRPEAAGLLEKALATPGSGVRGEAAMRAELLAQGSAAAAKKVLDGMPASNRDEQNDKFNAYVRTVESLAAYDVPAAERLLDEMEKQPADNVQWHFARAARPVIEALATRDTSRALALLRRVTLEKAEPSMLRPVVQRLPKVQAFELLREAATAFDTHAYNASEALSRLAVLAMEIDPIAGRDILKMARDVVQLQRESTVDPSGRTQQGPRAVAQLAAALSLVDAPAARQLLEEEWAFVKGATEKDERAQRALVAAMALLDSGRALDMAWQLRSRNNEVDRALMVQFDAQRDIALVVLEPANFGRVTREGP